MATSSAPDSTRSRATSSTARWVATTGLFSTSPCFIAQVNMPESVVRAWFALTAPRSLPMVRMWAATCARVMCLMGSRLNGFSEKVSLDLNQTAHL